MNEKNAEFARLFNAVDLNQAGAARILHLSQETISRYLGGKIEPKEVTLEVLRQYVQRVQRAEGKRPPETSEAMVIGDGVYLDPDEARVLRKLMAKLNCERGDAGMPSGAAGEPRTPGGERHEGIPQQTSKRPRRAS